MFVGLALLCFLNHALAAGPNPILAFRNRIVGTFSEKYQTHLHHIAYRSYCTGARIGLGCGRFPVRPCNAARLDWCG